MLPNKQNSHCPCSGSIAASRRNIWLNCHVCPSRKCCNCLVACFIACCMNSHHVDFVAFIGSVSLQGMFFFQVHGHESRKQRTLHPSVPRSWEVALPCQLKTSKSKKTKRWESKKGTRRCNSVSWVAHTIAHQELQGCSEVRTHALTVPVKEATSCDWLYTTEVNVNLSNQLKWGSSKNLFAWSTSEQHCVLMPQVEPLPRNVKLNIQEDPAGSSMCKYTLSRLHYSLHPRWFCSSAELISGIEFEKALLVERNFLHCLYLFLFAVFLLHVDTLCA